ncbi:unnamed protein product [Discula destructiva]
MAKRQQQPDWFGVTLGAQDDYLDPLVRDRIELGLRDLEDGFRGLSKDEAAFIFISADLEANGEELLQRISHENLGTAQSQEALHANRWFMHNRFVTYDKHSGAVFRRRLQPRFGDRLGRAEHLILGPQQPGTGFVQSLTHIDTHILPARHLFWRDAFDLDREHFWLAIPRAPRLTEWECPHRAARCDHCRVFFGIAQEKSGHSLSESPLDLAARPERLCPYHYHWILTGRCLTPAQDQYLNHESQIASYLGSPWRRPHAELVRKCLEILTPEQDISSRFRHRRGDTEEQLRLCFQNGYTIMGTGDPFRMSAWDALQYSLRYQGLGAYGWGGQHLPSSFIADAAASPEMGPWADDLDRWVYTAQHRLQSFGYRLRIGMIVTLENETVFPIVICDRFCKYPVLWVHKQGTGDWAQGYSGVRGRIALEADDSNEGGEGEDHDGNSHGDEEGPGGDTRVDGNDESVNEEGTRERGRESGKHGQQTDGHTNDSYQAGPSHMPGTTIDDSNSNIMTDSQSTASSSVVITPSQDSQPEAQTIDVVPGISEAVNNDNNSPEPASAEDSGTSGVEDNIGNTAEPSDPKTSGASDPAPNEHASNDAEDALQNGSPSSTVSTSRPLTVAPNTSPPAVPSTPSTEPLESASSPPVNPPNAAAVANASTQNWPSNAPTGPARICYVCRGRGHVASTIFLFISFLCFFKSPSIPQPGLYDAQVHPLSKVSSQLI